MANAGCVSPRAPAPEPWGRRNRVNNHLKGRRARSPNAPPKRRTTDGSGQAVVFSHARPLSADAWEQGVINGTDFETSRETWEAYDAKRLAPQRLRLSKAAQGTADPDTP